MSDLLLTSLIIIICWVFYLKTKQQQKTPNKKPPSNSARMPFLSYLHDLKKCSTSGVNQA